MIERNGLLDHVAELLERAGKRIEDSEAELARHREKEQSLNEALLAVAKTADAIDPAGKFLVASGEKSDTLSVYAIDAASGALKLLQKAPAGKGANWVEIVAFDEAPRPLR